MLVAFGTGAEMETGTAPPLQIVGTVHSAIGCATIRRGNCAATPIMVGDPVCQGDVIETDANGRIGLRFIDDTVFNLSGDSRVELSEFVGNFDGTSCSALLTISRGIFAFVAGRWAKSGALRIDTPFGDIRGRIHAGGFGMLTLAALTFSMLKDAEAADPNIT